MATVPLCFIKKEKRKNKKINYLYQKIYVLLLLDYTTNFKKHKIYNKTHLKIEINSYNSIVLYLIQNYSTKLFFIIFRSF